MSPLLRLAFLGVAPEQLRALVQRHGGVEGCLAALDRGTGPMAAPPSAAECMHRLRRWGGAFEAAAEAGWAERFHHVEDPPWWLFREGNLDRLPAVAIVGTRRCTEYGRRIAAAMGEACAGSGWSVVSGMARGIDAAAHGGAVAAGGHSVAVLGSGPDFAYPVQNRRLRRELLASGGAVVTEYPPGAAPLPWRFPPRNRLISGLAAAVVVVETGERGGSLSTAARAVAQARPVFAVPGDIDRAASVGCNRLIRDGAIPVLGPDDLVAALSVVGR